MRPFSIRPGFRCGLLALAICLGTAASVAADAEKSYKEAILAVDDKKWSVALEALQQALAERPDAGGKPVLVYGRRFEPYTPHYFSGLAHYHLGNCGAALRSFALAESQGVIARDRQKSRSLQELSAECRERSPGTSPPAPPVAAPAPPAAGPSTSTPPPGAPPRGTDDAEARRRARDLLESIRETNTRLERELAAAAGQGLDARALSSLEQERSQIQRRSQQLARRFADENARSSGPEVTELAREAAEIREQLDQLLVRFRAESARVSSPAPPGRPATGTQPPASPPGATSSPSRPAAPPREPAASPPPGASVEPGTAPEPDAPSLSPGSSSEAPPIVREVAAAYLAGDYRKVLERIGSIGGDSPPTRLAGCLLESAASYSLSRLSVGEEAASLQTRAQQAVERCREVSPEFQPSPLDFSPSFLGFWDSTTGST